MAELETYSIKIQTEGDTGGADKVSQSLKDVKDKTDDVSKSSDEGKGHFSEFVEKFALGELAARGVEVGLDKAKDAIKDSMQAASDDENAFAQMGAVIKSTGDASGVSAEEQEKYAESLAATTPTTKQAIMAGENMISTFTGIKGDAFTGATQAANNMATFFNGGLAPSMQQVSDQAMQIGKALNDPATGMAKLQREGVTFNAQEQEQIKTMSAAGDTAGAQAVMLKELQTEFGNAGTAASQTFGGGLQMVKNQLDELKVQVGESFMNEFAGVFQKLGPVIEDLSPVIEKLADAVAGIADAIIANIPVISQILSNIIGAAGQLVPAIAPLISIVVSFALTLSQMLQPILAAIMPLLPTIASLFSAIGDVLSGVLQAILPIIVGLLGGLVDAIKIIEPPLETIIGAFGDAFTAIMKALQPVLPVISMALKGVATAIGEILTALTPVIPVLAQLIVQIIGSLAPYLPQIIKAFLELIPPLVSLIPPLVQIVTALLPLLTQYLGFIIPIVAQVITWIAQLAAGIIGGLVSALSTVVDWVARFVTYIAGIAGKVMGAVGNFASLLLQPGKDLIQGLINGVTGMIGGAVNAVKNVGNGLISGFKSLLGIHSPSTVFTEAGMNIGQGLVNGITGMQDDVNDAIGGLAGGTINAGVNLTTGVSGSLTGAVAAAGSTGPGASTTNNYSIGQVVLSTAEAVQTFFGYQDQDTLNLSKGLTANRALQ